MVYDQRLFEHYIEKKILEGNKVGKEMKVLRFLYSWPGFVRIISIVEDLIKSILNLPIPIYKDVINLIITYLPGNPYLLGNYLRALYYSKKLKYIGKNVIIEEGVKIMHPHSTEIGEFTLIDKNVIIGVGHAKIGKRVHISPNALILGSGKCYIGDYCAISIGAKIITSTEVPLNGARLSGPMAPYYQRNVKICDVDIKKDAFIGASATIMPGVVVEEGGIIGAGFIAFKGTNKWEIKYGQIPQDVKTKQREKVRFDNAEGE